MSFFIVLLFYCILDQINGALVCTRNVFQKHYKLSVLFVLLNLQLYRLHVFLYFQEFLIAIGMRGVTHEHRVVPSSLGWYDQVIKYIFKKTSCKPHEIKAPFKMGLWTSQKGVMINQSC